jgi:fibro-slime domain-containing protein
MKIQKGLTEKMTALTRNTIPIFTAIFAAGLYILPAKAADQTFMVKVIYYDYDIVGKPRNPDFEYSADIVAKGMIQDTLTLDRKPIFKQNLCYNLHLDQWFRASDTTSSDTTTKFLFDKTAEQWKWTNLTSYNGTPNEWVSPAYSVLDSMRNIIIYDSLLFTAVSGQDGVFQYSNKAFFPINGRGFGNQPDNTPETIGKNYGFAMEIHRDFDYLGGEFFKFEGDDDLWVFINGTLALDIGGIHGATVGQFYLDSLAAALKLTKGNKYPIDIFYAERHIVDSDILITTNIIRPRPNQLKVFPHDTILTAGDTLQIKAQIRDTRNKVMTTLLDSIQWRIITPVRPGDNITDKRTIITPDSVSLIKFTATKAFDTVWIEASLKDPNNGVLVYKDTAMIYIKAGKLFRLVLEDKNGIALPDALALYANPSKGIADQTIVAAGYDFYSNKITGGIASTWSKDGTLHALDQTQGTQIFYTAENVRKGEKGIIKAIAIEDPSKSDSIAITIIVSVAISQAITRDVSGNGYLDAIEVTFTEKIKFPDVLVPGTITVSDQKSGTNLRFPIKNVMTKSGLPAAGMTDSVFIVNLQELVLFDEVPPAIRNAPETDWTPTITIEDLPGVENMSKKTTDGAGPVVWRAYLKTAMYADHKNDKVSIKFSEKVTDATGGPYFSMTTVSPPDLFNVVKYNPTTKTYTPAWDILDPLDGNAIESFTMVASDSAEFLMTNGRILTGDYLFAIDSSKNLIRDVNNPFNYPNENNHFVKLIASGWLGDLTIGPNPLMPVMKYVDEKLTYIYPPEAIRRTKEEGGAVILANVALNDAFKDNPCGYKLKALLMIFDAVGNLVYKRQNTDNILTPEIAPVLCTDWVPGEVKQIALYWNGITDNNGSSYRKAAPGIYRVVLFLTSDIDGTRKYTGNVGVGR